MTDSKVMSLASFLNRRKTLRRQKKKVVFTNGCFDVLHYGHISYLTKARKIGHFLVIGLNSDRSVRQLKGTGRPIFPQKERARVLAALNCVDAVIVFKEDTPLKLIQKIKPDVLIKGGDWPLRKIVGYDFVKSYGGSVQRISFIKNRSTSKTLSIISRL